MEQDLLQSLIFTHQQAGLGVPQVSLKLDGILAPLPWETLPLLEEALTQPVVQFPMSSTFTTLLETLGKLPDSPWQEINFR